MLYSFVPHAPAARPKDLGWAYNRYMALLPDEDDWACLIDHDALFTTRTWYAQVEAIIARHPDAGCFTAMTNRVGNPTQVLNYDVSLLAGAENRVARHNEILNALHGNHDMKSHRELGERLQTERYGDTQELDVSSAMSGVVMVLRKAVWRKVPFTGGFLGVDRRFHRACAANGLKVYLMLGVYVYHWYRGDGNIDHIRGFLGCDPVDIA